MIISHKHKYIFIGLPFSGSSAISKELLEEYDGESIYFKHTNIQSVLNNKDINIEEYFVFAVYRDPVDICKTTYSKYINNAKNVYTDKAFLIENGGHISKRQVELYYTILDNNLSFNEFLKIKHKGFIPYDNVYSLNEKYLNYTIQFSNLNEDFKNALAKIGFKALRELPLYNKTSNKIEISKKNDLSIFEPFYNRNQKILKILFKREFKLVIGLLKYRTLQPFRRYIWLNKDKTIGNGKDEYFVKDIN